MGAPAGLPDIPDDREATSRGTLDGLMTAVYDHRRVIDRRQLAAGSGNGALSTNGQRDCMKARMLLRRTVTP
jgi:hypothetical protein